MNASTIPIKVRSRRGFTLERHLKEEERNFPEAKGVFTTVMSQISLAAKIINAEVNKAGLVDILGLTGHANIHLRSWRRASRNRPWR